MQLNYDHIDFVRSELVVSAVVEPGRPSALVRRGLRRLLDRTAVPQVFGYPGRPERVAPDLQRKARVRR